MAMKLCKILPRVNNYNRGLVRYSTNPCLDEKKVDHNKRIIHGEEYPIWTKHINDIPGELKSKFELLGNRTNYGPSLLKVFSYPLSMWPGNFKKWWKELSDEFDVKNQEFSMERVNILGYNLATAFFICYRGGRVRLHNRKEWIVKEKRQELALPNKYQPGYYIEAIDCENMIFKGICYEGLSNIAGLDFVKWISFKNSVLIDDWCLDRISNLCKSLEYIDLTGTSITYRGLNAFYRMENLKLIILDKKIAGENLNQICAMLEEINPNLLIKIG